MFDVGFASLATNSVMRSTYAVIHEPEATMQPMLFYSLVSVTVGDAMNERSLEKLHTTWGHSYRSTGVWRLPQSQGWAVHGTQRYRPRSVLATYFKLRITSPVIIVELSRQSGLPLR